MRGFGNMYPLPTTKKTAKTRFFAVFSLFFALSLRNLFTRTLPKTQLKTQLFVQPVLPKILFPFQNHSSRSLFGCYFFHPSGKEQTIPLPPHVGRFGGLALAARLKDQLTYQPFYCSRPYLCPSRAATDGLTLRVGMIHSFFSRPFGRGSPYVENEKNFSVSPSDSPAPLTTDNPGDTALPQTRQHCALLPFYFTGEKEQPA